MQHDVVALDRGGVAPRPDEQPMRREHLVDVGGEHGPRCGQHDEVVADALEVGRPGGSTARRSDSPSATAARERRQELPTRERVQRGDRFVQQQHPRPLAEAQRERDLRPLATGQRPTC